MVSYSKYVLRVCYFDGNITHDDVIGSGYDKDVVSFVKLRYTLKYKEFLNILYNKLYIDLKLYKLGVSCRFMNHVIKKYGVVLIEDDDDLEFMLESLEDSDNRVRVELYIEKVPTDLEQSLFDIVNYSKVGETFENTYNTYNLKSVQGGNVFSENSSKTMFMSSSFDSD